MATTSTYSPERRFTPDRRAGNVSTNKMSTLGWIAMALLIVGGINWGLIGFFGFDLVAAIFGAMSLMSRIVYALVGVSALYSIYNCAKLSGRTKT